jgi:hypothetical protein
MRRGATNTQNRLHTSCGTNCGTQFFSPTSADVPFLLSNSNFTKSEYFQKQTSERGSLPERKWQRFPSFREARARRCLAAWPYCSGGLCENRCAHISMCFLASPFVNIPLFLASCVLVRRNSCARAVEINSRACLFGFRFQFCAAFFPS